MTRTAIFAPAMTERTEIAILCTNPHSFSITTILHSCQIHPKSMWMNPV